MLNDPNSLPLIRQAQYADVQDMERSLFLAEALASCDKVTQNIVLRRLEGYSWKEIERRCGVSSGAARKRFSSTVQRLRKAFRRANERHEEVFLLARRETKAKESKRESRILRRHSSDSSRSISPKSIQTLEERAVPQSHAETLGPRTPASRCFHRLPRFSLLPVLQDLQRFLARLETEPMTSTNCPRAVDGSRDLEAQKNVNFRPHICRFFCLFIVEGSSRRILPRELGGPNPPL